MAERTSHQQRRRATLASGLLALSALALTPSAAEARTPPLPMPIDVADHDAPSGELLDACPVDGHSTFEDSWGWARSGGRTHQGVDLIAERGTPVVAVRDGDANFKTNGLGGRAVWLTTDDGDRFYYAHLDDWAGESRRVEAGEVIGYVGSTGNANGPHLHFETHPNDAVENPFGHTLRACVSPALSAAIDPMASIWMRFV